MYIAQPLSAELLKLLIPLKVKYSTVCEDCTTKICRVVDKVAGSIEDKYTIGIYGDCTTTTMSCTMTTIYPVVDKVAGSTEVLSAMIPPSARPAELLMKLLVPLKL